GGSPRCTMDQIIPKTLSFDRFELDLLRGCVRVAGRDLDLRPKAFHLLCHLAENGGRLGSKQELHESVWGDVTGSDDALVQCIRALRSKLGEADRTVIRPIPRRGYLLNAATCVPDVAVAATTPVEAPAPHALSRPWYVRAPARWAAAVAVVMLALVPVP